MGTKGVDLEWKEFFGSSVSLVPSLITIYDEKVRKDSIPSGSDELSPTLQTDPRKRPSSIRSNDSSSSASLRPSKKKMAPSAKNLTFTKFSTKNNDFSLGLERGCELKGNDLMEKNFENRRSKSVENCLRVKKQASFNSFLVCREILETEKLYLNDLKETIEGYKRVMESRPDLFVPEIVAILFGNLEDIYSFHCELLKELNLHERNVGKLSESFINNAAHFKMYSAYCTNYPRSQKIMMNVLREENASSWLQEQQIVLNHKLPLSSYLLKPVQRILKYHLLFQNLLKSFDGCDVDTSEFMRASSALGCMSSVARYINEMKRIHDKTIRMKEVLDLLIACNPNVDLSESGELIIEDKFQFGTKTLQHILLFEREILICKWKENCALVVKVQIPCSNLMLVETVSKSPLSFSIHPFTDPSLLFTIQAKSFEQKSIWCHEIRKSIISNFDAHIPDRARNIVMNLAPDIASIDRIDEKGFGQIEWRKSVRRCSMAFVPDIRQSAKSNELLSSSDASCLEEKQKHLPLSQSLFSVADELSLDQVPANFSISSSTLTTKSPDEWLQDRESFSAYATLGTLDRSYMIGHQQSKSPEFACHEGKENMLILKRNSSVDNCLTSRSDDRSENLSQRSEEISRGSNSLAGSHRSWSDSRPNIPKRSGSVHRSSLQSTSPKTSFRNTLLNLKDRFKRRSLSTDNRHYRSTPKLQSTLENNADYMRNVSSQKLMSRFALPSKKLKSNLSDGKDIVEPDDSSPCSSSPLNLGSGFADEAKASPSATRSKCFAVREHSKSCFSPPSTSNILFIDDSDDC